jgi:hypothetical protein
MNSIKTFFAKLFGTHTVDSAMTGVNNAIAHLESVAEHQKERAEAALDRATEHLKAQRDAEVEHLRASKLAQKLRAFFA